MASNDYNASDLVLRLHSLPHYDLRFKDVSAQFEPSNGNYLQALVQFALPFMVVSGVFVIFYYIRICFCEAKFETQPSPSSAGNIRCRITICIILTTLSVSLAIYGNQQTHSSVLSFQDDVKSANATLQTIVEDGGSLVTQLTMFYSVINSLNSLAVNPADISEIKDLLNASILQCDDILSTGQQYDFTFMNSYIDRYEQLRYAMMLTFLLVLLVMTFGLWIGACRRGQRSLYWTSLVIVFGILIAGTISGASFALSVASADFCYDPNGFIVSYFNNPAASYYATCNETLDPFSGQLTTVEGYINATIIFAAKVDAADLAANLSASVDSISESFNILEAAVSCPVIHDSYTTAVSHVCGSLLQAIFIIAVAQGAMMLMLIVLVHFTIVGLKVFNGEYGYFLLEDYEPPVGRTQEKTKSGYETYTL